MSRHARAFAVVATVLLPFAAAQQEPPAPAPQLQRLAPMLGNWAGSGTARLGPGEPVPWQARCTLQWCLDGHFVQEDFTISFAGHATPLVFRAYLGWDRELGGYVNVSVNNGGAAQRNAFHLLDDGTMLQVMRQHQNGLPYAERTRTRLVGEAMTMAIDMLMADGPSLQVVEGTLTRTDEPFAIDWDTPAWQSAMPSPELQRLLRSAGEYDVQGAIVPAPGQPEIPIAGTDSFRGRFGDTIFHGHTDGAAEGTPGRYVGEVFWSFDEVRKCLVGVYVSNQGEVMAMDAWWGEDDRLISTFAGTMRGQPVAQRMLLSFDEKGRAKDAVAHAVVGTWAPFESFRATYAPK